MSTHMFTQQSADGNYLELENDMQLPTASMYTSFNLSSHKSVGF